MDTRLHKSETPHFFKIIILKDDDDLQRGGLRIPPKFVRLHGGDLADSVILEVPGGDTWHVKLLKEDGKFFLQEGWPDFVKHYGVKNGHFVIFRYEVGSKFHVVIFDTTAYEIDYPVKPTGRPPQELKCYAKRKRQPSQCSPPAKIARTSVPCRLTFGGGHAVTNIAMRYSPAFEEAQKSCTLSRASSFRCNQSSALIMIQPSYVCPKYCFYMSKDFVKTFIPEGKRCGDIRLYTPDERTWIVGYSIRKCYSTVECGWRKFAVDNDLRVGDVCVFESRTGGDEVAFRVSIFQSRPPSSVSKRTTRSGNQGGPSTHEDSKFGTHPSFRVKIHPSALIHCLDVPASFTNEHLKRKKAITVVLDATLMVAEKSWAVKIKNSAPRFDRYRIVQGWRKFCRENGLRRGDVCEFRLVDKDWVFQVSVSRKGKV